MVTDTTLDISNSRWMNYGKTAAITNTPPWTTPGGTYPDVGHTPTKTQNE